jgi:hypothetical protein
MSEVLNRIIQMTEATELSANDYVHIQSQTLGDRKIQAGLLAVGTFILDDTEMDTTGDGTATYTFANTLDDGYYILSFKNITDDRPIYDFLLKVDGSNHIAFGWDDFTPKYSGYLSNTELYMACTAGGHAVFNVKLSKLNPAQTY